MAAVKNKENAGMLKVKGVVKKPVSKVYSFGSDMKKIAEDDPRKIVHSIKVGLAIALVSLFYYFEPFFHYEGFGVSAMWAVLTVVVVFEFSVGATLGKSVNRGIATFLAGSLGVGAHKLVNLSGSDKLQPVVLGLSVFLIAAIATSMRFVPKLKARYDYGILIFILTFSLISVSGYRDNEVLDMAITRVTTILIGGAAAILFNVVICPVWAGEDLHNLVATNIEKLGISLEGYGNQYLKLDVNLEELDRTFLEEYKCIIHSKAIEVNLVNLAKWEPRHGKFRYRHPWEQYLKIGDLVRDCAINIDALNTCLSSCIMTPEGKARIQEPCTKMSVECGCALKELALSMKTMIIYPTTDSHILKAKAAAEKLRSIIRSGSLAEEAELRQLLPTTRVASLMLDLVSSSVEILDSVNQLAVLMKFKILASKPKRLGSKNRIPSGNIGEAHIAINVE
ncbi:PREDICTED: aluminum-activated malate transporter 2-like [Nicotiana attenuata]|uniref:Aluminum-activated malate transporter 2 n=1 Tax=Nicotiana attenuata TaxID=49451 RepID=A0A314L8Y4_NICAT|nr:PREDICTED: aluminum-activated malate transporter 2-like [Nicotiana attenuata]OIT38028.1 aluminum-activated malate transporter 2 [Nicotiana attenuata]